MALPTTMTSAPASTLRRTRWGSRMPPPTMSGTEVALLTAAIISLGTGRCAPLPASIANAVASAPPDLDGFLANAVLVA